jgi:hypothetical protein
MLKPATLATRLEPAFGSSSGGRLCNVPTVGALGEHLAALVGPDGDAVGDRMPVQLLHRLVIRGFQRQIVVFLISS